MSSVDDIYPEDDHNEQDDEVNNEQDDNITYVYFPVDKRYTPLQGVAVINALNPEGNFTLVLSEFGDMKLTDAIGSLTTAAEMKKAILLGSAFGFTQDPDDED